MALTQKDYQKAYRIRQKAKKQARLAAKSKKELRQAKSPLERASVSHTHMQRCLAGLVDDVDKVCASYDGNITTVVGPTFGPVHITGTDALWAYSIANGISEEQCLDGRVPVGTGIDTEWFPANDCPELASDR